METRWAEPALTFRGRLGFLGWGALKRHYNESFRERAITGTAAMQYDKVVNL